MTTKARTNILLVANEEGRANRTRTMLERLGCAVTVATDSLTALRLFLHGPYVVDLAIVDETMPEVSGAHLARGMLRVRPDIPVIVCSRIHTRNDEERERSASVPLSIHRR